MASRPKTFTTSGAPEVSMASTRNTPSRWRSAAPTDRVGTPRPASATTTSSRPGRPRHEPNTRCTTAAAIVPITTPAIAPVGVDAPSSTEASAASATTQRSTRRAGWLRWGDAVIATAAGMLSRRGANHAPAIRSAPVNVGHAFNAARSTTTAITNATAAARTRSRSSENRRRTTVATSSPTAARPSRSISSRQRLSKVLGTARASVVRARSYPAWGTATRLSSASSTTATSSRMTSVARRARGSSTPLEKSRARRRARGVAVSCSSGPIDAESGTGHRPRTDLTFRRLATFTPM